MTQSLNAALRFSATLCFFAILTPTAHAEKLRGRAIDAQTGAALPCRLYVQAEDGTWLFAKSAGKEGSAIKYSVERGVNSVEKHVYRMGLDRLGL